MQLLDWCEDEAFPTLAESFQQYMVAYVDAIERDVNDELRAWHGKWKGEVAQLDFQDRLAKWREPTTIKLDKDSLAETLCAFDSAKITYTEEASKVVLHSSTFKHDVLAEFQKQAHTVAEEVTEQVHAKLATPVQEFEAAVAAERNKVEAIYAQNQALLEASMSNEEVEAAIASAKEQRRSFEAELKQMQDAMQHFRSIAGRDVVGDAAASG